MTDVGSVFQAAKDAHLAAKQAKAAMAEVMLRAFRRILPPDSMLDLRFSRENLPPAHLVSVSTLRGNDRGTRLFRIVGVVAVDVDPLYPSLSKWIADAVPISEKTGAPMKASTGHGSRETVRLQGYVGSDFGVDEPPGVTDARVLNLVATNLSDAANLGERHERLLGE